jgi:hypothetical protein
MPTKVYCPNCKQQTGLIRIIDYGNCQPPTRFKSLADSGEIILRKGARGSDALYATSCCKIGFSEYGTFGGWVLLVRRNDKKDLDDFFKKEEQLVGKSYAKEILQSTGKV